MILANTMASSVSLHHAPSGVGGRSAPTAGWGPSPGAGVTSRLVIDRKTTTARMVARKTKLVVVVPHPRPPSGVGWER
jgi:hypothetical protein